MEISGDYGCKTLSYINNIHPVKHLGLYTVIQIIIACVVPLWGIPLKYSQKTYEQGRIIGWERVEFGRNSRPGPTQRDGEDKVDYGWR